MTRSKHLLFSIVAVLLGVFGFLLFAELACRILPVNEGMRVQAVTRDQPVFRFESNRSAIYAKGWDFAIVNRARSNNVGFISDQDYRTDDPRPLWALIGDSYIEALMVPYNETIQARLAAAADARGRVYAFAASGAGLAQYLSWAAHARDTYHPQAVSFLIIPNDFSEALYDRERSPGFHGFARRPDGSAELKLTEYQPSTLRSLMRESALAMYLFSQVKIQNMVPTSIGFHGKDVRYVGNVEASLPEEFVQQSKWATDRFLDLIPEYTGLPHDRVQIMVESIRPNLYDAKTMPEGEASYWGQMRAYMIEQARARGYDVVDLHSALAARWQERHQRFEFPSDGHWNGEGHAAAAAAVQSSRLWREVMGGPDSVSK